MGVGLGLGAALSWGLADYFAALAGRAVGAQRVVVGFCLLATELLAIVVLAAGGLGPVDAGRLPLFVGSARSAGFPIWPSTERWPSARRHAWRVTRSSRRPATGPDSTAASRT